MRDGDAGCFLLVIVAELYVVSRVKDGWVVCTCSDGGEAYLNRYVGRVGRRLGLHIGDDSGPVAAFDEGYGGPPIVPIVGADGAVSEGGKEASTPAWECVSQGSRAFGAFGGLYTSSACRLDGCGGIAR